MSLKISSLSKESFILAKLEDYKQLVKFRLNLFVVFSAVASFIIVSQWSVSWSAALLLGVGGFLITGAANALNEVLEKDYDRLMKRTSNRPLPAGRMSVSEAVLMAGFMFVVGLFVLALFNPLCAVLGSFAVISYAFIYTPIKRFSTIAVAIGAIPGALPVLIGAVAFEGTITPLALVLFGIQFIWQFPHFWSIGWLGFDDYKLAGYKLVPEEDGRPDRGIGKQSMYYTLLLLPLLAFGFYLGVLSMISLVLVSVAAVLYAASGYNLYIKADNNAARKLMFSSFLFLPIVLATLLIFG